MRAEHLYGEYGNVSLRSGTFTPPVFPTLLPNDPCVPYITNFLFTQPLSPNWVVFGGRKDVLGSYDQDVFAGGDGTDQFGPVPRALFGPRNGMGVEWFYNIQATPWLNITPDLQWLRPGLGAASTDNAFVSSLRPKATF